MAKGINKHWYIGTKKNDINIWFSSDKSNYKAWGIEKEKHGFSIHLGRTHFHYEKYLHEQVS